MGRKMKELRSLGPFGDAYNFWLTRILRLAYSTVEWKGLPKSVDAIYLEKCIVAGSGIVVKDDILGKIVCGKNTSVGDLDIYGFPMDRRVVFRNGVEMRCEVDNSVIVYGNSMRMSDLYTFQYLAKRMANIDCAVDVNINTQKTMPIIPTTQDQALTIQNLYSDVINNIPYALVEQNTVDVEAFKSALLFDNRKSYTADLMTSTQRELWNRILTYVGVNNVNIEKKERTITPEINSNLDEIFYMRKDRLNARKQAAEVMSRKFGLSVTVDYAQPKEGSGIYGTLYGTGKNDSGASVSGQTPGSND